MPAARKPQSAVNLRLPKHMLDRADDLRQHAAHAPEMAVLPNITRSDVLRLALLRGLADLEAEYEEIVDEELVRESERRLADPENQERIPLEVMLGKHGLWATT